MVDPSGKNLLNTRHLKSLICMYKKVILETYDIPENIREELASSAATPDPDMTSKATPPNFLNIPDFRDDAVEYFNGQKS